MPGLIVHEWIEKRGGAERVLDQMVAQYPDADIACLWNDVPDRYSDNRVIESWMASTPFRRRKALALPLMPATWRRMVPDEDYDWILASSYVFAHHASLRRKADQPRKFVYVHTPARYLWAPEFDPRGSSHSVRLAAPCLRAMDRAAAVHESSLASNSEFIRDRVRLAWNRDSRVIHPPVDVAGIGSVRNWGDSVDSSESALLDALPEVFLLGASRFVEYKGLDKVIRAGELCGLPVVLAGTGPLEAVLADMARRASVPVFLITSPSDSMLFTLYQRALVFIFPPVEDFGIMPVEAMAAGCPALVNSIGGTSESVIDGVSGYQLDRFDGGELVTAVHRAAALDRKLVHESSLRFDSSRFRLELDAWIGNPAIHKPAREEENVSHRGASSGSRGAI